MLLLWLLVAIVVVDNVAGNLYNNMGVCVCRK